MNRPQPTPGPGNHPNALAKEISTEIRAIARDLEIFSKERNRIPERVFKEMFLPMFAGVERNFPNAVQPQDWVDIAGGNAKEVEVHDHTGKTLFVVPPLVNLHAYQLNPTQIGQKNLFDIITSAKQVLAAYGEAKADAFLSHHLKTRMNLDVPQQETARNLLIWDSIFTRYGYPSIFAAAPDEQAQEEGKQEGATNNVDDWEDA